MNRDGHKNKKLYLERLINLPRQSGEEKDGQSERADTETLLWNALEELSLQLSKRTTELQKSKVHLRQERGKRKGLQLTLRSLASELVLTEERERRSLARAQGPDHSDGSFKQCLQAGKRNLKGICRRNVARPGVFGFVPWIYLLSAIRAQREARYLQTQLLESKNLPTNESVADFRILVYEVCDMHANLPG